MEKQTLFRQLPQINLLLSHPLLALSPHDLAAKEARLLLAQLREEIQQGLRREVPSPDQLATHLAQRLNHQEQPHLRRVLNATGVVLHTNLGRAPLAEVAAQAAYQAAQGYSNLEYNLQAGTRGSRHSHVKALLQELTGAEDGLVVNNNAGAVLLMLAALAQGGEVIVSRGELVEIGGSFRVPEVMEQSGAILREVGATNKTHPADYSRAIGPDTKALLKVHASNYKIVGFTRQATVEELKAVAGDLPVLGDLGSGLLRPLEGGLLPDEPTVAGWMAEGADLITFSGDKLLGGPQVGIIVGRKDLVSQLKRHPLARALRIDKMTLAALEATLRLYQQGNQELIPTWGMLTAGEELLRQKGQQLYDAIEAVCPGAFGLQLLPMDGPVGGGSAPGEFLPGWCVALERANLPQLEELLRKQELPLLGRMHKGMLWLDLRTLTQEEIPMVAQALADGLAQLQQEKMEGDYGI